MKGLAAPGMSVQRTVARAFTLLVHGGIAIGPLAHAAIINSIAFEMARQAVGVFRVPV